MSATADMQTVLADDAPLDALVDGAIEPDAITQGAGRPFVIHTITSTEPERGLDGTVHARRYTMEVQCWGDTRDQAEAVADAAQTAIDASDDGTVIDRTTGYDSDLALNADILTVEWWGD